MTRTPPAASDFLPGHGPRFRSPPGARLIPRTAIEADNEPNMAPVLVCAKCNAPTQHARAYVGQICWCLTCKTERRW